MLKVVGVSDVFEHLLNDPTTPGLRVLVPTPQHDLSPKIEVVGLKKGPILAHDAVRVQAARVFTTIAFTVSWVQKIRPFDKWALGDKLIVVPRAGRDFNAFYDRTGLHFYYDAHPVTRKVVFTADSTEAVDHELGHAILDTFCPHLWDLNDPESMAFKESFGDIISMISSLHRSQVITYALNETGGDLRRSNVISRIAEELGNAIYHREPHNGRSPEYLRDAVEFFLYADPNTLPVQSPYSTLSREPHNFSRVFTGAWYDLFVSAVDELCTKMTKLEAIDVTRDRLAQLTIHSLKRLNQPPLFSAMARAMMDTDGELYFNFKPVIRRVFTKRGILPPELLF